MQTVTRLCALRAPILLRAVQKSALFLVTKIPCQTLFLRAAFKRASFVGKKMLHGHCNYRLVAITNLNPSQIYSPIQSDDYRPVPFNRIRRIDTAASSHGQTCAEFFISS